MIIDNKVTDHVNYLSHLKNELTSIAIANTVLFYGSHSGISSHVLCLVLFVATNSKCHNIFLKSCMLFLYKSLYSFRPNLFTHSLPSNNISLRHCLWCCLPWPQHWIFPPEQSILKVAVELDARCHSKNFVSLYISSLVTTCATKNPCWALRLTHSV